MGLWMLLMQWKRRLLMPWKPKTAMNFFAVYGKDCNALGKSPEPLDVVSLESRQ
jgi:hypothetical protein